MRLLVLFAVCLSLWGQAAAVDTAALPSYTIGEGPSFTRGALSRFASDTTLAIHIGQGQWYSWTDLSTPLSKPAAGPSISSFSTGGAWIPVQSGSASLIFIVQAGYSPVASTSTVAPTFTGSVGVTFCLGKSNVYVMPYLRAASSTAGPTGSPATAVLQPGIQVMYGFGGKK